MKRVLLIDDNPADRDLLMRHLCRSFDTMECVRSSAARILKRLLRREASTS